MALVELCKSVGVSARPRVRVSLLLVFFRFSDQRRLRSSLPILGDEALTFVCIDGIARLNGNRIRATIP